MGKGEGISELDNQPLEEVIDKLGEDLVISILENGKVKPDIDPETETVQIEFQGMGQIGTNQYSLKYKEREGLSKIHVPLDLIYEVPYMVGQKTGEKRLTEKEPSISTYATIGSFITSGAFTLNYFSRRFTDVSAEISERASLATAFGAYMSAGFFHGRQEAINENILEDELDELVSNAGDYEVEFY